MYSNKELLAKKLYEEVNEVTINVPWEKLPDKPNEGEMDYKGFWRHVVNIVEEFQKGGEDGKESK